MLPETMEQIHQAADAKLGDARVAIIPDAGDDDALFPAAGNIHIGALLIVQAAAHSDIPHIGTGLDHRPGNEGGKGYQNPVGVSDAADHFFQALGNVLIGHILPAQGFQLFHMLFVHSDGLDGHQFFKHDFCLLFPWF